MERLAADPAQPARGDFEPTESAPELGAAPAEDRWIVSRLQRAIADVSSLLDAYDFAHAVAELYRFVFDELCDWYLEIVKPRLYEGDEPRRGDAGLDAAAGRSRWPTR